MRLPTRCLTTSATKQPLQACEKGTNLTSAFEQAWSGGLVSLATSFAASNATPWGAFEVAKASAEQVRTNTLAPARATQDIGLAQADHDFLSGLAGELASYLTASTEQENAKALAQATADLAATVDRAQTLLGTTDDLGNPVPIDWSTLIMLPGGATGLPANFTPVDPDDPPIADTLTGGSSAEPIVPFLLPLLLPMAPQRRLAPDAAEPDRRELPDDHREAANGTNRPRGQLSPTHGSTGNWNDLYAPAFNSPQGSDDPPEHPKRIVNHVERQERENGTRLRLNPDEMLAGGPDEQVAEILRNRDIAAVGGGSVTVWFSRTPVGTYLGTVEAQNERGESVMIGHIVRHNDRNAIQTTEGLTVDLERFQDKVAELKAKQQLPQNQAGWNSLLATLVTVNKSTNPEEVKAHKQGTMGAIAATMTIAVVEITTKLGSEAVVNLTISKLGPATFELVADGTKWILNRKQVVELARSVGMKIDEAIEITAKHLDELAKRLKNKRGHNAAPRSIGAKTWQEYESGVRNLYGEASFRSRKYRTIVDGKVVNGVADNVVTISGRNVAVEAKWVKDGWANSPRNPASTIGNLPFAVKERATMLEQARKYSAFFDEVIYHSNSPELIAHYTKVFQDAGITNFRFILTQ